MPTELEFEMYGEKEIALPKFTGYISRGLFLTMHRRVDPRIAQKFHEPQTPKPYSVIPLRFKSKARTPDGYIRDPTYPCRVKFRFLEEGHIRRLIEYFAEKGGNDLGHNLQDRFTVVEFEGLFGA